MGRYNHRLDLIRLAAHSSSECYTHLPAHGLRFAAQSQRFLEMGKK
jgi:hypothetical protein